MQPLNAAAQNAKGLVCEARGALPAAVAAFTAASELSSQPASLQGESCNLRSSNRLMLPVCLVACSITRQGCLLLLGL